MASGHVNRTERPNTWLHRPTCVREEKPLPIRSRPHMAVRPEGANHQCKNRFGAQARHLQTTA
jgi:hypothetical protein